MFNAEDLKNRISKYLADGAFREVPTEVVEELRAAWKSSELTQVQFADAVGLNVSQLSSKFYSRKSRKQRERAISSSDLKSVSIAPAPKPLKKSIFIHLAGGHRVELADVEQLVGVMRALC